jgi:transposase
MKKPTATRQKEKTEIEQLSQAEGVEMVLALQKIIIRIARKTSYCYCYNLIGVR